LRRLPVFAPLSGSPEDHPVRTLSFLALALLVGLLSSPGAAQQPPKADQKAMVLYGNFRELMSEGRYDIAANFLKAFLDANPTDAELLEIEKQYGTTAFTGLRTVPKWSDDPAADKAARANVEELVKRARAAADKLLRDPARVMKFIRNLGATYEERVFAEMELRRIGDFAVPYMVNELRITRDTDVYAGILGAIRQLEATTIGGWVAALDGFSPEQQYGVVNAIAGRQDVLDLQGFAQSDLSPFLWRVLAQPKDHSPDPAGPGRKPAGPAAPG
jgi:hypothetical protein